VYMYWKTGSPQLPSYSS